MHLPTTDCSGVRNDRPMRTERPPWHSRYTAILLTSRPPLISVISVCQADAVP
jgi:hypothetical protein